MSRVMTILSAGLALCAVSAAVWLTPAAREQGLYTGVNSGPDVPPQQRSAFLQREMAALTRIGALDRAGIAAMNVGDYATAEADARESMSIGVASGRSQELLAASLYAQGKTRTALQVYQRIAAAGANAGRNEWPYALLLLRAGHWAQAVNAYDTALGLGGDMDILRADARFSPDVSQPAELAAAIHVGMGLTLDGGDFHGTYRDRIAQGQAHFRQALSLEPNSALTNYYVGYGLRRLGRVAEARVAFQRAAALGQGDIKQAAEEVLKRG